MKEGFYNLSRTSSNLTELKLQLTWLVYLVLYIKYENGMIITEMETDLIKVFIE